MFKSVHVLFSDKGVKCVHYIIIKIKVKVPRK